MGMEVRRWGPRGGPGAQAGKTWRGEKGGCVCEPAGSTLGCEWQALEARSSGAGQVRDSGSRKQDCPCCLVDPAVMTCLG